MFIELIPQDSIVLRTALPAYVRFHLEHISAVPLLLVAWACVGWFCPYVFHSDALQLW